MQDDLENIFVPRSLIGECDNDLDEVSLGEEITIEIPRLEREGTGSGEPSYLTQVENRPAIHTDVFEDVFEEVGRDRRIERQWCRRHVRLNCEPPYISRLSRFGMRVLLGCFQFHEVRRFRADHCNRQSGNNYFLLHLSILAEMPTQVYFP